MSGDHVGPENLWKDRFKRRRREALVRGLLGETSPRVQNCNAIEGRKLRANLAELRDQEADFKARYEMDKRHLRELHQSIGSPVSHGTKLKQDLYQFKPIWHLPGQRDRASRKRVNSYLPLVNLPPLYSSSNKKPRSTEELRQALSYFSLTDDEREKSAARPRTGPLFIVFR